MRHKHYEMIVAWAEGKEIEYRHEASHHWARIELRPRWDCASCEYRIKPEPKPDVVQFLVRKDDESLAWDSWAARQYDRNGNWHPCIKVTIDGETGKLKAAEVIA